ncbi:MAG: hypothetical protein HUJ56_02955 [Erysipelotrichaceae bacterium]|nr:hypothetical protein [Erysipelotrichaceae bacterium]
MKTLLKGGIKIIILLAIVVASLFVSSEVLRVRRDEPPNDTYRKVRGYYALEEETMDIVMLGTSQSYYGMSPAVMYHETGLNMYDFGGECQPMEVTYHYLVEALKTQKPQLVILDIFGLADASSYCRTDGIYRVNIEELKLSQNKIEAYQLLENESLLENIFDVSLYHTQWSQMDWETIKTAFEYEENPLFGYTKGARSSDAIWKRDYIISEERIKPDEKQWNGFVKIVELCEEYNQPLLVVKTPCYLEELDAANLAYAYDYLDEKGIPYIDFNLKFNDMGYVFDRDGDMWHASLSGSGMITKEVAKYINENYNLTSIEPEKYREKYESLYNEIVLQLMAEAYTALDALHYLSVYDELVFYSINKDEGYVLDDDYKGALTIMGINPYNDKNQVSVVDNNWNQAYGEDEVVTYEYQGVTYEIHPDGAVYRDGVCITKGGNTISITIIDKLTNQKMESYCINIEEGFVIRYAE